MDTTQKTPKGLYKSQFVRDKIKADISSGKYIHQLPGAAAMAKKLGVNPLTVNKAFAMLEKEGLVEVVSRKGTFIKGKKHIGLIIYKSGTPDGSPDSHAIPQVFSRVMEGVHEGISEFHYTLLTHTLYDSDKEGIQRIIDEVDGLIILSGNPRSKDFEIFRDIPWVKVMGTLDNPNDANHVSYNNDEIGVMAAKNLMKNKCEKFYYFGGRDELFTYRYDSFRKTLEKNNCKAEIIELDYARLTLDVLAPLAKKRFEEIFNRDHHKVGLFLSSTSYLTLTYQLLYSLGVIPMTDLHIVTCENMRPVINGIIPQPDIIDLHMKEIGKRGVETLIKLLRNPHKKNVYEKIMLTPELIESSYNKIHKKF